MKVGVVMASDLNKSIMAPNYYLDRCVNCGKREAEYGTRIAYHKNGRCGSYKWLFVESGTSFENEYEQAK